MYLSGIDSSAATTASKGEGAVTNPAYEDPVVKEERSAGFSRCD